MRVYSILLNRVIRFKCFCAGLFGRDIAFNWMGERYFIKAEEGSAYHIINSTRKIYRLAELVASDAHVVFDVGAHCGIFSSFVRKLNKKCEIHVFEPSRELIPVIMKNIDNAIINVTAVSNFTGESIFYMNRQSQQQNSLKEGSTTFFVSKDSQIEKEYVTVTTIDDYCHLNNINKIDAIKIDVQGSESEVLEGAKRMLCYTEQVFLEACWLDEKSVESYFILRKDYGFNYAYVVNDVYLGADLLLSRKPIISSVHGLHEL